MIGEPRPEQEMLYHYTGPAGLLGIAQSKALWASNIRYLNDASEYLHAVNVARSLVQQIADIHPTEREFFDYLLGHSEVGAWIRSRSFGADYYVASLTSRPDLLSQWRAYAPKSGYCIGWLRESLQRVASFNGFDLKPCIYAPEEQQRLLKLVVEGALQRLRERPCIIDFSSTFWSPQNDAEIEAYTELGRHTLEFDAPFAEVATVCKHPTFAEEEEWRLVSRRYPNGRRLTAKFRNGRSVLIPYIDISLDFELVGVGREASQTRIICGPSPEIDLAQNSAMQVFAQAGWLGGTWTSQSQQPYRDW